MIKSKLKIVIWTSILVSILISIYGCDTKPAAEKHAKVQQATTDDGKTVELRGDGTWAYPDAKSVAVPAPKKNSVLSLEAGLVFKSGDVKPVARTEFQLLDTSLTKILLDAGAKPPGSGFKEDPEYGLLFTYALASNGLGDGKNFPKNIFEIVGKHIVQSTTSDFGGKAKFAPVPQGTYYLSAISHTPNGYVIWNSKVELTSAESSITLDQNNAKVAL